MAKLYYVGGYLRDEILGVKSKDIDFAVEAESFDAMRQDILDRGCKIWLETQKYFTIRAKMPNVGDVDFVLARKDGEYIDGRHPESVQIGTIYDDLARRDFTMNAIAKDYDTGEILDPFGGINDIKNRMIQCVGKPVDRFTEDRLRILRALRFSITKKFDIAYDTLLAMSNPLIIDDFSGVSGERIREELMKMFTADTVATLMALNEHVDIRNAIFDNFNMKLEPVFRQ